MVNSSWILVVMVVSGCRSISTAVATSELAPSSTPSADQRELRDRALSVRSTWTEARGVAEEPVPELSPKHEVRLVPAQETGVSSEAMSCGLWNPMPDGFAAGYAADTGLDLAGMKLPVFAIAAGKVDYAEGGHSLWSGRGDTDLAVRIELDEPISLGDGRSVTHVWYAHLVELAFEQEEGAQTRLSVKAGQQLGISGRANGMWHLHLGLLLDGDTSQRWGSFLLEDEVRTVLCGLRPRTRLPKR